MSCRSHLIPISILFFFSVIFSVQKSCQCHLHLNKFDSETLKLSSRLCWVSPGPLPLLQIGWKDSEETAERYSPLRFIRAMQLDYMAASCGKRHSAWRVQFFPVSPSHEVTQSVLFK